MIRNDYGNGKAAAFREVLAAIAKKRAAAEAAFTRHLTGDVDNNHPAVMGKIAGLIAACQDIKQVVEGKLKRTLEHEANRLPNP